MSAKTPDEPQWSPDEEYRREHEGHAHQMTIKMPHEGHQYHLCYLHNVGFVQDKFEEYKKLVKDSKFVCTQCGRTAASDKNLCGAQKI